MTIFFTLQLCKETSFLFSFALLVAKCWSYKSAKLSNCVLYCVLSTSARYNVSAIRVEVKLLECRYQCKTVQNWTDSMDSLTISHFYSAQWLDLFAWCFRLNRLLVDFWMH